MAAGGHPFGASVAGSINYIKPAALGSRSPVGRKGRDIGLQQGGEFMKNNVRGTDGKGNFDSKEMQVYDARPARDSLSIDRNGFLFAPMHSALPSTLEVLLEEDEAEIRRTYWPEVCDLVKRTVKSDGRSPKYVFALGTQKFTEDKSRGLLGSYSRSAHADFSDVVFDRAYKMLTKRGVPEQEAQALDIMFVNIWRPFGRAVTDNPLAILDWTSVDPERDVHGLKRGMSKHLTKGSIYGCSVTHNPAHRWVYLPGMRPDEAWLFKQADSRERPGLAKHAFHTSFRGSGFGAADRTRRSIAVRTILAFERPGRASL